MPDFLLEIGTEEIPARMIQARAARNCRSASTNLLCRKNSLSRSQGAITHSATPRRLALIGVRHSCHAAGRAGATYRAGYKGRI